MTFQQTTFCEKNMNVGGGLKNLYSDLGDDSWTVALKQMKFVL
jgi:hypothetical protein